MKNKEWKREYDKKYRKKNKERIRAYQRKYREEHIEEYKQRAKEYRERITLEVMTHYSKGKPVCVCCGEERMEFLTIDHVEGGGTAHRKVLGRYGKHFYRWLYQQGFPDGYQILCYNCNCSLGRFGYCPHEKEKENEEK